MKSVVKTICSKKHSAFAAEDQKLRLQTSVVFERERGRDREIIKRKRGRERGCVRERKRGRDDTQRKGTPIEGERLINIFQKLIKNFKNLSKV